MAITDNRTLIADAEVVDPGGAGVWEDETGSNMGVGPDTRHIEGSGSISQRISQAIGAVLWNFESAQDFTGSVIYVWMNMTTPASLDTAAGGGIRMRFTGATVTDWFDVFLEGADTYNGGWKMLVVDVDLAKAASDAVNGTPPATTAIERVGIVFDVTGMAAGADANCLVDAMWSLAAATPGIIVAGQNASNPWTLEDIVQAADISDDTKAWGTCNRLLNGTVEVNTPIQFGLDDVTQDEFADTNEVMGFADNPVPDGFYGLSIVAGSGACDVDFGLKTGSGNDATGAQGFIITSGGPRWFIDFDDADLDGANLYGCTLIGGGTFELDDDLVDFASVTMIDCEKAHLSNANVVRLSVVAPATADGVAFCDTDDLGDIANSSFEFSDGHGIEILSGGPSSQNNIGNIFLGAYGGTPGDNNTPSSGSTDAMIYNNSADDKIFNRSGGGTQPSFRNGASATSDDVAAISLTFTPLETNSEVRLYETGTNTQIDGVEDSGASFVASAGASQALDYKIINPGFLEINVKNVSFATSQNVIVNQQVDRDFITDAP